MLNLDAKLKENLESLAMGLQVIGLAGQEYATEIANGINKTIDSIEQLGKKLTEKKRNTQALLTANDLTKLDAAVSNCNEIATDSKALMDSLTSLICKVKAGTLKANLKKLEKSLNDNKAFIDKLGPALADCPNSGFTPWQQKECKGPCAFEWENYAIDENCKKKLDAVFGVEPELPCWGLFDDCDEVITYLKVFKTALTENKSMNLKPNRNPKLSVTGSAIKLNGDVYSKIHVNYKGKKNYAYKINPTDIVRTEKGLVCKDNWTGEVIFEVIVEGDKQTEATANIWKYIRTKNEYDNKTDFIDLPFRMTGGLTAYKSRGMTESLGYYTTPNPTKQFANSSNKFTSTNKLFYFKDVDKLSDDALVNQLLGNMIYGEGPENIELPFNCSHAKNYSKGIMFKGLLCEWQKTSFTKPNLAASMGISDELILDLTGQFTTFEHFLGSVNVRIKQIDRTSKTVVFEVANVTSFGSGYLMKDVGKILSLKEFLFKTPFPEPPSTPRIHTKPEYAYSNISQYFSFSMTFNEINSIIVNSYPVRVLYSNGVATTVQPKYNLLK